jgi:hypothetical protein
MSDALFGLPEAPKAKESPGPVYQGVGKAIRYLEQLHAAEDDGWSTRFAGTIAQARSLAASIDRASGRDPNRRQAAGRDLSDLHERLDALMLRLDPEDAAATDTGDAWAELTQELTQLEVEQRRRTMQGGQS